MSSRAGFDHGVLSETIRAKLTEWPAAGRVWLAHKAETPDEVLGVALAIEPGGENAVASVPLPTRFPLLPLIRAGR